MKNVSEHFGELLVPFPDRDMWEEDVVLARPNGFQFYNVGSRMDGMTALGYFCGEMRVGICSRLPDDNTVS